MAPMELCPSITYVGKHSYTPAAEEAVQLCLDALLESASEWQPVKTQDGVRVMKKEQPGMPVPLVRGGATLRGSALGLVRLLSSDDEPTQLKLDPQLKRFQVLEHLDEQTKVFVTEFKGVFPVANRFFVLVQTVRRVEQGLLVASASIEHPGSAAVVSAGAVRGTLVYGGWLFRDNAGSCDVTYVANTNLNGNIPKFVINMVVNDNPMIVRNLGQLADKVGLNDEVLQDEPAAEPPAEAESLHVESADKPQSAAPSEFLEDPSSGNKSWREWSGRENGKQGYKFGDLTRGIVKAQQLKKQARKARQAGDSIVSSDSTMVKTSSERTPAASTAPLAAVAEKAPAVTLDEFFTEAQLAIKSLSQMSNEDKLEVYGHYKQATVGNAHGSRPSAMNVKERYKYDAWARLMNKSSDEAKEGYCALADRLSPGWRATLENRSAQPEQGEAPAVSLDEIFAEAQSAIKGLSQMSNEDKLQVYAHYKQATVGDVQGSRPSAMNVKDRYKYDSWAKIAGMTKDAAKEAYCSLADRLAPGWRAKFVTPTAPPAPSAAKGKVDAAATRQAPQAIAPAASRSRSRDFALGSALVTSLCGLFLARWPARLRRHYRGMVLLLILALQRLRPVRPLVAAVGAQLSLRLPQ